MELPAQVSRLVAFFESLSPALLAQLDEFYAPQVYFKDPFNEVCGLVQVEAIFSHMYATLEKPRFVVTESLVHGDQCFLTWNFEFYFKNSGRTTLQTIRGGSHLKFDTRGLVTYHRDYWDAAEELYEKLPVLGGFMRWLKRRAST